MTSPDRDAVLAEIERVHGPEVAHFMLDAATVLIVPTCCLQVGDEIVKAPLRLLTSPNPAVVTSLEAGQPGLVLVGFAGGERYGVGREHEWVVRRSHVLVLPQDSSEATADAADGQAGREGQDPATSRAAAHKEEPEAATPGSKDTEGAILSERSAR